MSFIDRLIDSALHKLSGSDFARNLAPDLLEELHYIRIGRRKARWIPLHRLAPQGSRRENELLSAIFSMFALLTKAGGRVSDRDLEALNEISVEGLRLNPQQRALAMQIMRKAKTGGPPFQEHVERLRSLAADTPAFFESILDGLLSLSYCNGFPMQPRERLVNLAAACFGVGQDKLASMRARHMELSLLRRALEEFKRGRKAAEDRKVEQAARESLGGFGAESRRAEAQSHARTEGSLDKAYKILGCERSDSKEAVRKRYRRLALGYHPDRLRAKGLAEETLRQYERQFREIHEAYETIKKERGWR